MHSQEMKLVLSDLLLLHKKVKGFNEISPSFPLTTTKDFLQKIKRFDYSGDYVLAQGESKEPIKDYTALVDLLDMVSSTFGNVALRLGLEFQG